MLVASKAQASSIYLRALDITDLERVLAWHNDPALYDQLGGHFRWISRAAEEEWLRRRCAFSTNEVNLAICLSGNHEHIGNIYLREIDWTARNSELHVFIASPAHRGHGYGEAAVRGSLMHAFGDLGLQRVFLYLLASNQPAYQLYRKCGFVEEGRLRNHAYKRGDYLDVLVMGILNSEWEA